MSNGQRMGLIALAIVVVAVAFVVARPDDDEEKQGADRAAQGTTSETAARPPETTPTATTESRPEHRVRLRAHKPVGGVVRIEAKKGDFVRITVESDEPDEIHLHGYDIEKAVAPGEPARFSFRADIEGDFEMEGHEGGEAVVARVVVEPA